MKPYMWVDMHPYPWYNWRPYKWSSWMTDFIALDLPPLLQCCADITTNSTYSLAGQWWRPPNFCHFPHNVSKIHRAIPVTLSLMHAPWHCPTNVCGKILSGALRSGESSPNISLTHTHTPSCYVVHKGVPHKNGYPKKTLLEVLRSINSTILSWIWIHIHMNEAAKCES